MANANPVPRRPGDQTFRKNDVLRLIDCAKRKGLSDYKIMAGGLTLAVGESEPAPPDINADKNPWLKDIK